MKNIAIINPFRTAVGAFNGTLSTVSAPDMCSEVIKKCLENGRFNDEIQEVYFGNVLQAGIGQNPARQAAIKAGVPVKVPASTINTVCGSGLHAVALAYNSVMLGNADMVLCGGMENMSSAPYLLKNARNGYRLGNGELVDSLVNDGLTCPINNYHMGITAENVAEKYEISRKEQDEFAILSQYRAHTAKSNGYFKNEIVPIKVKSKKDEIIFYEDEYIKGDTSLDKLAQLKPAFKKDGTVTAGNASGINDGAASMIVASMEKCRQIDVKPFAYIRGYSLVGVDPKYMGMGPVDAVNALLQKTGVKKEEIDIFELNEAFAVQSLAVIRELKLDPEKVNVTGGAIAIGHPIGASGARILVTLVHNMKRLGLRLGIASLCIGTGMGIAMLVENAEY